MRQLIDLAQPGQHASTLVILLPGAYGQPQDFVHAGFISAVRMRLLPMDILMAELPFDQVADDSILAEIHSSLVEPALKVDYRQIWLAGISIGGYVAMAYADHYPGQLSGMLLLAPYPGNRMTTGEISSVGGIHAWTPAPIAADDTERRIWFWLKNHAGSIPVHLGYGLDDRFAAGHVLMAQALLPANLDTLPGSHDWPVWQQLWQNFLDRQFMYLQSTSGQLQAHG